MISYRFVPISSQKGVLFLRHPVCTFWVGGCAIGKAYLLIFVAVFLQMQIAN